MRKWDKAKSRIEVVRALKSSGADDLEIRKFLGISRTTFEKWKKEHPEFLQALTEEASIETKTKDKEVEDALLRLATGYTRNVKKLFKVKKSYYDENQKKVEEEILKPGEEEIVFPPSLKAQEFWLKCRCPETWGEMKEQEEEGDFGVVILPPAEEE